MNKKIYIKTWGCQMNEYDSSLIATLLQKSYNFIIINNPKNADVLILNTCSIREKAHEKVFHQLGRWKKIKQKNSELIIAVGGCVATQEGEKIYKRTKYVNIIFGTQTLHRLPEMILQSFKSKKLIIDVSFPKMEKFNFLPKITNYKIQSFSPITSSISIMEGCKKYCSFCIVPYTRGTEISRLPSDILSEIQSLANSGTREIILLGQNVNAYRGRNIDGSICKFSHLLRLVAKIEKINRIRFITSNPIEFTDDIIEVYSDTPKLVNYLHLPIQSGSDRILKLMRRSHTVLEYKKIIKKLTMVRPNIQISSDFIIGFPGENNIDFKKTMKLISDINFDFSYSFLYSPRPGTPASKLIDNVDSTEKKKRLIILQNKISEQAIYWSKKMQGTIQKTLVKGISQKNIMELRGITENNRIVYFSGSYKLIGKIVDLHIIKVRKHTLQGIIIEK